MSPFPTHQPGGASDPLPVMRRELKLLLIEVNMLRVEVEQLRVMREEARPGTRHQRCWVHKTTNVLNKVALSVYGPTEGGLPQPFPRRSTFGARLIFVAHDEA